MKTSEVFAVARKRLPTGYEHRLWWLIYFAVDDDSRREPQRIIKERLDGFNTEEDWLSVRAKVPPEDMTPENIMEWKLLWLDSLIAEFAAKGD